MPSGDFILSKKNIKSKNKLFLSNKKPSPEMLEIFNNLWFLVVFSFKIFCNIQKYYLKVIPFKDNLVKKVLKNLIRDKK